MPWKPVHPGELPTLGIKAIHWITANLIVPDGITAGDPLVLTDEQVRFVLRLYAIDPTFDGPVVSGRSLRNARTVRRAVLSRPKGWGKSPLLSALCLFEALGPAVFDGWDSVGRPVGRPWNSLGFKPKVQLAAVAEDQTTNSWDPLLDMARNGPVADNYDIEALDTFVNVPRGRIEYVTSSAETREGFRPVFAVFDQTESWIPGKGGIKLAAVIRRNIGKVQGATVETPNAFVPGEDSVAERSHKAWVLQESGQTKVDRGLLYDHREAPPDTDISDRESMIEGLTVAYGDSADVNGGWVSLERQLAEFWDPDTDPADGRRYYLNQVGAAEDAWLAEFEWSGCGPIYVEESQDLRWLDGSSVDDKRPRKGDLITLGFDGSRSRKRGTTDATALIGCRIRDGHLFTIGIWEQPPDWPRGQEWKVPVTVVEASVAAAFATYDVAGFYADPAKWETYVAAWEARYGPKLRVKSTVAHPIEWWMVGGRSALIVRMLEKFHSAVVDRELTHDGSPRLTAHVLNARRHPTRSGLQIRKEFPDSSKKIDAAVAASLAWQCRLDAIAKGVTEKPRRAPRRIR